MQLAEGDLAARKLLREQRDQVGAGADHDHLRGEAPGRGFDTARLHRAHGDAGVERHAALLLQPRREAGDRLAAVHPQLVRAVQRAGQVRAERIGQ